MLEHRPGGDPQGCQGHAAAEPPRPPAASQAEGLCRPDHPHAAQPSPRHWRSRLDAGRADAGRAGARGADARGAPAGDPGQPDQEPSAEQPSAPEETSGCRRGVAARGAAGRGGGAGRGAAGRGGGGAGGPPSQAGPAQEGSPPSAPSGDGEGAKKKEDVVPGAELDPIAIEPERELDAEERARREAEEEERARRERSSSATWMRPRRSRRSRPSCQVMPGSPPPASGSLRSPA